MTKKLEFHNEKRIVDDLIPFEHNPRVLTKEAQAKLQKSLEKFGLVEVPVINTDNVIVAGHQRIATLKLLGRGAEEIDVRVPNRKMTQKEVEEYNIRSNRNVGDWDFDILANAFDQQDLLEWGFERHEIFFYDEASGEEIADRAMVLTVEAPEAVRLAERHSFYCEKKSDYDKLVKFFTKGDGAELDTKKLLDLI